MTKKDRAAVALGLAVTLFAAGCSAQMASVKRRPIFDQSKDLISIPKKLEKKAWPKGTIIPVAKGQVAPMNGVLFSEKRARSLADLRLSYDQLYRVAEINRRFAEVVFKTADRELGNADKEIARLRNRQNSWWQRNKVMVAIVTTFVLTLGFGALVTWGAIELKK